MAAWTASRLPQGLLHHIAHVAGIFHYGLAGRKRRAYLANTRAIARFDGNQRPWHAFQSHALNVLELLRAAGDRKLIDRTNLHGQEHIDDALSQGRGLILATFHLGNWELAGIGLALRGYPITTVAGEQLHRAWSEDAKELKRRLGIRVIDPRAGCRTLFRDLHANRIIVLHIDGDAFSGGVAVPFLGRRATMPRGPARLARVLESPTALAYCRREGRGDLHIYVEPPMPPPKTDSQEYERTVTLAAKVEECILERPGQWCIFREF